MRGSQHILLCQQRGAAMKLSVIHDPGHPRVPVGPRRHTAHDSVLLVGTTALCESERSLLNPNGREMRHLEYLDSPWSLHAIKKCLL